MLCAMVGEPIRKSDGPRTGATVSEMPVMCYVSSAMTADVRKGLVTTLRNCERRPREQQASLLELPSWRSYELCLIADTPTAILASARAIGSTIVTRPDA
jgi:hypothetical protein